DVANTQPILRPTQSPQPFDATAARFLRLVSEMRFERTSHRSSNVRLQPPEVFDGFRGENNGERHSGYNIARFSLAVKPVTSRPAGMVATSSTKLTLVQCSNASPALVAIGTLL